ncbi:MAG TPA: hypothetical protein VE779_05640 [Candidatus Angelobacter sp.]|jgi:hypothetical protein|nr:hypothetical protein [Candidatus Angelobacter sp.]
MEFYFIWIMYGVICVVILMVRVVICLMRKERASAEQSLCLTCVHAVVTRGTRGQKWVACNLAAALRPVKFTVCECTGHCLPSGSARLVTIEGFVPEKREVYAEVAIT